MTNQASEDRLRKDIEHIILTWSSEISGQPREKLHPEADQFVIRLVDLIRTEKLKLLAEVRERVVGEKNDLYFKNKIPQTLPEYMDDVVKVREQLRVEQREVLAKLEAEL